MGSLYRSEDMVLCQFYIQYEAAYSCVSELGELGLVQFRDINVNTPVLQRQFVNEIRRCDDMTRMLRSLEKDIKLHEIKFVEPEGDLKAPLPKEIVDLEANLDKKLAELNEVDGNSNALNKTYTELLEFKNILIKIDQIFNFPEVPEAAADMMADSKPLTARRNTVSPIQFGFIAGVIIRDKLASFETILWRLSRGNAYLRYVDIEEPFKNFETNSFIAKSVFVIFFQGEHLKLKIKKLCDSFQATIYPCPETREERYHLLDGVKVRLEDLNIVMNQTNDHHYRLLSNAAQDWKKSFIKVQKMKQIYFVLNMFSNDVTRECLIAEAWCPLRDITNVYRAVEEATTRSGSTAPSIVNTLTSHEVHPTYNKTNKVTSGFQNIVDAYGVSKYKEVNPAPFTIITFPFLFAVMFGDAGHGLIMLLFALWMVLKEGYLSTKMRDNEIWQTFFGGRYIILLMGAFSIYTGLIYNDMFSLSANIFGSAWNSQNISEKTLIDNPTYQVNPNISYRDHPYYFGMDPVWQIAGNKINYLNSYKMKLAIILGVTQMVFGVILSLFNHLYWKKPLNIICEFIPQLIFILSIFGYLDFLIIYKWFRFSYDDAGVAPNILVAFINMFMFKGTPADAMFEGQLELQKYLVIIAAISVPWMLLIKPFVILYQYKARGKFEPLDSHSEEFNFSELFITQAIHAIEFCLGSISHTASYLRLWALSLAHSQLSEVLWSMILRMGISNTGWSGFIILYALFTGWAVLTVCILLVMEGLSAFLHALRLHWVEFQSKFYLGTGYLYMPFSLKIDCDQFSD